MKQLIALILISSFSSCFAKDLKLSCSGDEPIFNIHIDEQNLILELPTEQIETTFSVSGKKKIGKQTKLELERNLGDQTISNVVIQKAKKFECQEVELKNKQTISFKLNGRKMNGCCTGTN